MGSVNVNREVDIEFTQEEIRNIKVACFALKQAAQGLFDEDYVTETFYEISETAVDLWNILKHHCGETDDSLQKEWSRY